MCNSGDNVLTQKRDLISQAIYCLITACVVLMICSRSSFLYPFNIWDDANGFFTMGKSMIHGLVPYRDLFEPKGILLYVLYAMGYLMSHTTFGGVFIIEVFAAGASLFFALKILLLYLKKLTAYILTPIFAALVYSSRSFYWGGSAEEFMLPFFLCGMYLLLNHITFNSQKSMHICDIFWGGLCAGCILHIKFNSLGFFIGWVITVTVLVLMSDDTHKFRTLIQSSTAFLAGILIITVPVVVYFGIHDAIDDWIRCCFYDTIFIYSEPLPLKEHLIRAVKTVYYHILTNKRFFLLIIFGIGFDIIYALIKRNRREIFSCLAIILGFGFHLIGIFSGGIDLPYYPFPLSVFAIIGIARFGMIIEFLWTRVYSKKTSELKEHDSAKQKTMGWATVVLSVVLSMIICYIGSANTVDIGTEKEDLYIYKFRDYILSTGIQNPRLINMGFFDAGLYTLLDSVPECYYYQTTTMPIPDVWETQKEYVKTKRPDYILSCVGYLDFDTSGYKVVMKETDYSTGFETNYWLYEKISD